MSIASIKPSTWAILLFLLAVLLFARASNYQFVWDDQRSHLTQHEDLMKGRLGEIWKKPYDGMYIPVTYSIWYGVKQLSGKGQTLEPKKFHQLNILFHGFNVVLCFWLLMVLYKDTGAAVMGALLFCLHPLQVESVAWVSEFRGLLSAFAGFSFMLLTLHANDTTISVKRKRAFQLLALLLLLTAMLSKPSGIVFPLIMLIILHFYRSIELKKLVLPGIIWLLPMLPIMLLTIQSQPTEGMLEPLNFLQKLSLSFTSIGFYFSKLVVPYPLAACYGYTPLSWINSPQHYVYLLLTIVVLIGTFLFRKKWQELPISVLMIIVGLLPVVGWSSFYYQRYSTVADRYMYVPMFAAAFLLASIWQKWSTKSHLKWGMISMIFILGILSFQQLPTWENEFSMWDQSLQHFPEQWTAAYNRGVQNGKMNKYKEAIADYSVALNYKPNDKNTLVNRANAYGQTNQFAYALRDYSHAIQLDPNDGSIYYDRALTYYYSGDIERSVADLKKAIELHFPVDPEFAKTLKAEWIKLRNRGN